MVAHSALEPTDIERFNGPNPKKEEAHMPSMKPGVSGGQSVAERDPRLMDSKNGRVADQRLRDLDRPSSERVFGNSPARGDSNAERESENLRQATVPHC